MYHSISPSLISLKLMGVLYHLMKSTEYPLILKSPITCFLGESHKSSDQMVMSTCYWVHSVYLGLVVYKPCTVIVYLAVQILHTQYPSVLNPTCSCTHSH